MQSRNSLATLPTQLQLGLLSPLYLRKLFERMGATYVKLGQVSAGYCFSLITGKTNSCEVLDMVTIED